LWIAENKACHVSALFVEWSVSDRLKIFLYRWAVSIAGTKQPPTEIIRGGEESYSNDFYLVRLKLSPSSREFRAKSLLPEGVEGIWFGQDHVGHEAVVPNWALPEMYFAWEHFYRSLFIDGVSAFRFVLYHFTGYARYIRWRETFYQFAYNRKRLARRDRITILRYFFQEYVKDNRFSVTAAGLAARLYGTRWVLHPKHDESHAYYRLLLNSLVQSGDIIRQHDRFFIDAQALETIAAADESDRRHRDNIWYQRILAALTFGLILVGAPQAFFNGMAALQRCC